MRGGGHAIDGGIRCCTAEKGGLIHLEEWNKSGIGRIDVKLD